MDATQGVHGKKITNGIHKPRVVAQMHAPEHSVYVAEIKGRCGDTAHILCANLRWARLSAFFLDTSRHIRVSLVTSTDSSSRRR